MHTIRLRGPWQIQQVAKAAQPNSTTIEIAIPTDWGSALGSDYPGPARYIRRFGLPTNLSPDEKVSLAVSGLDWRGELTLNGEKLGVQTWTDGERKYDVTRLLQLRNELQIVISLPQLPEAWEARAQTEREGKCGGLLGEVRLEIHS